MNLTNRQKIALQLALKSIERMNVPSANASKSCESYNLEFSNQVATLYNTIFL